MLGKSWYCKSYTRWVGLDCLRRFRWFFVVNVNVPTNPIYWNGWNQREFQDRTVPYKAIYLWEFRFLKWPLMNKGSHHYFLRAEISPASFPSTFSHVRWLTWRAGSFQNFIREKTAKSHEGLHHLWPDSWQNMRGILQGYFQNLVGSYHSRWPEL